MIVGACKLDSTIVKIKNLSVLAIAASLDLYICMFVINVHFNCFISFSKKIMVHVHRLTVSLGSTCDLEITVTLLCH